MNQQTTFDEVFKIWLNNEVRGVEGRDLLPVAQQKGFTSVTEWRLSTALRLGMDTKEWHLETINNPNDTLPNVTVGPYQGWSKFFDNKLETTFAEALEIPEFKKWCDTHDRVIPMTKNFPLPSTIILYRRPDGRLIHIEGGHRMCAVAYAKKIGKPIDFSIGTITAAIADISEGDIPKMLDFLQIGTFKQ